MTADTYNITATPTFVFFRNMVRVDNYQGADAANVEEKIKQHTENDPGNSGDSDIPKGYVSRETLLATSFDAPHDLCWLYALRVVLFLRWTSCLLSTKLAASA